MAGSRAAARKSKLRRARLPVDLLAGSAKPDRDGARRLGCQVESAPGCLQSEPGRPRGKVQRCGSDRMDRAYRAAVGGQRGVRTAAATRRARRLAATDALFRVG